jgi:hypothetical protein
VPRGYPRQEVPVGPGDVSGMCLTTDIRIRAYQPRNRSVFTFLSGNWIGYAMGCVPQTSLMALENSQAVVCGTVTLRTYYQ